MPRRNFDVRKTCAAIKNCHPDLRILAPHRGCRFNGLPENSIAAIRAAWDAGFEAIEVDIMTTSDGFPILHHDNGLGRVTNVGEMTGNKVYSPFTGQGYSPLVESVPWKGLGENLSLKDEYGNITSEKLLLFEDLLKFIQDNDIPMLILMDVKHYDALKQIYDVILKYSSRGVPAHEWCIWKLPVHWFPSQSVIDATSWGADAKARGLSLPLIPLFIGEFGIPEDKCIDIAKNYLSQDNVLTLEINTVAPNCCLQPVLSTFRQHLAVSQPEKLAGERSGACCWVMSGDFFQPVEGKKMAYDVGEMVLPIPRQQWSNRQGIHWSPLYYTDGRVPLCMEKIVPAWCLPEGKDHRADFDWLVRENFGVFIVDHPEEFEQELSKKGLRNISHILA